MRQQQTPFDAYLERVLSGLAQLDQETRANIAAELRAHLNDAAAARGVPAEDGALQRAVIAGLGPARRLGRRLLLARLRPAERRVRDLLWLGAAGALLVPLIVLSAFVIQIERVAELTLIGAQSALLLTIPAIHALCRRQAPRLSLAAALAGLLGGLTLPIATLLSWLPAPPAGLPALAGIGLLSLTSLWAILTSLLLSRPDIAPALGARGAPAFLGILWGSMWLVMVTNATPALAWASPGLVGLALMCWLFSMCLWCLWMGAALLMVRRGGGYRRVIAA